MEFDELTDDNYVIYAMKAYENPHCKGLDEFTDDLNITKYIKRLLKKYQRSGVLRERLILNHIIVFCNVFGVQPGVRMLFHRMECDLYPYLKTFLIYLEYTPIHMDRDEIFNNISIDNNISDALQKL
jgi:hypothetical protein